MKLYVVFTVAMAFAFPSFSEHLTTQTSHRRPVSSPACPGFDINDPFSLSVRYNKGPRQGECMNLFDYRPVHLLTEEEALQYAAKAQLPPPEPGEVWVGNVWHRGKFYVVRVPALAVEDVLFQIERFDPEVPILRALNKRRWFAAHAQVRFKLKKDKKATFIPQKLNDLSPAIELSDVVISSEAVRRKGEPFGPLKGNADHYGLAKRALSLDEAVDVSVRKLKHQIAQYAIKMPAGAQSIDEKRQDYLLSALRRSDRDFQSYKRGIPVYYNTQDRNCLSDAVDIFDEVTDYSCVSRGGERFTETRPRELLPALRQRGLLENFRYPTVNEEFGYPNY